MPVCICVFLVILDCGKKIQYVVWFNTKYFYDGVWRVQDHDASIYDREPSWIVVFLLFSPSSHGNDKSQLLYEA